MFKGLAEKTAFYQHNIVGVSKWEGSEKILHCNVALIKSGLDAARIDDGKSGSVVSARSIGPDHRIGDKVSWNGTLSKVLRYSTLELVVSRFGIVSNMPLKWR